MKITLSVLKADVGSIGGHLRPSERMLEIVRAHVRLESAGLILDHQVSSTGDDIALLMTHRRGPGDERIHRLAWNAFLAATDTARDQGLYGAGQDLLRDSFAGNLRGMGPAVVEIEFEEREAEPFLFLAADKTDPGAFNLPLYLAFADPMNTPGLLLAPDMKRGFCFTIQDVACTEGDRRIELDAPEDLYDIAALLRDPERYVVHSVYSRGSGEVAAAVSTTRLHNIAGKYTGKDDPVMLVRVQKGFPATGEILAPYAIGHYVGGGMRGSHHMPLMPVPLGSGVSYFDGPPVVTCAAFCVREGKLTEPVDAFAHPFWDEVRRHVAAKAIEMRRQGFFGAAMLPWSELEYTGITERLAALESRFTVAGLPDGGGEHAPEAEPSVKRPRRAPAPAGARASDARTTGARAGPRRVRAGNRRARADLPELPPRPREPREPRAPEVPERVEPPYVPGLPDLPSPVGPPEVEPPLG